MNGVALVGIFSLNVTYKTLVTTWDEEKYGKDPSGFCNNANNKS